MTMNDPASVSDHQAQEGQPRWVTGSEPVSELGQQIEAADLRSEIADLRRQLAEAKANNALAVTAVAPQRSVEAIIAQRDAIEQLIEQVFKPRIHYGEPYPGAKKMVLLKAGAELFMSMFGVRPSWIELLVIEDFENSLFAYRIRCDVIAIGSGQILGSGEGSCNSKEDRYAFRAAKQTCPTCGQQAIIKGKAEYGGGWLCWKSKGGCGAKFAADDVRITGQVLGKVPNENIWDLHNTILKMAEKRAMMAAVITLAGIAGTFEAMEDEEDDPDAPPSVVNGSATQTQPKKNGTLGTEDVKRLVDTAMSLLPETAKADRGKVGAACLAALGVKTWESVVLPFDAAKLVIESKIMEKFTPPAPQEDAKPDPLAEAPSVYQYDASSESGVFAVGRLAISRAKDKGLDLSFTAMDPVNLQIAPWPTVTLRGTPQEWASLIDSADFPPTRFKSGVVYVYANQDAFMMKVTWEKDNDLEIQIKGVSWE